VRTSIPCLFGIEILKVKTKSLPPIPSQAGAKEPGLSEVDGTGTCYIGKAGEIKSLGLPTI
jgi:hypothetical protein